MSSKGLLRGASLTANAVWHRSSFFPKVTVSVHRKLVKFRSFSLTTTCSSLLPPDLPRLAKTAQISLTPNELQGVDLESVEPSIRAGLPNSKLICKMGYEKAQINIVVVGHVDPEEATTINELKKPVVEKEAPGHAI
ncbi:hypothetical protein JHK82_028827 [Glycine max]|nr:hypothetical protein JHK82_028827 [Glycine max]